MTDTTEYKSLLERFSKDEMLYEMKDSNEIASFLFYVLEPLTAERWQSRNFGGYAMSGFPYPSDNALLEYFFTLIIQSADALTVREYNDARLGIMADLQNILKNKTPDELQNKTFMEEVIHTELDHIIEQRATEKLQINIEYAFSPLTNLPVSNDENDNSNLQNTKEPETRQSPYGMEEDYRSLFTLKTSDYQDMSIANFNMALLEWTNENHDRMERISTDMTWNDFQVSLSSEELSFIKLTIFLSGTENAKYVQSNYTGRPEEDPNYDPYLPEKRVVKNGTAAWCDLYYQFSYHITDKEKTTIGERDRCVASMINSVQEFWDKTSIDDMLKMTESNLVRELQKIAAKNSNYHIKIVVKEDYVKFECLDERKINFN